jgi:hypothetical protein
MKHEIQNQIKKLINTKCWDASNVVTGTLKLNFGGAVLVQPKRAIEYAYYIAQYDILVWSEWRLDDENDALCSSCSDIERIARTIFHLIGDTVTDVNIFPPVWDTHITFSSGKTLKIFCNYAQDSDSLSNWDLGIMDTYYFMGKGNNIKKSMGRDFISESMIDANTLPPIDIEERVSRVIFPLVYDTNLKEYRITEEDVLRMNRDVYDYYESLNNLGKELVGIPDSEIHQFRFNAIQRFRTEWLEQFNQNRNYTEASMGGRFHP